MHLAYTSRKSESSESYLDLSTIQENWLLPKNIDLAILCAAATSLDWCKKNPSESWQINTEAPGIIAKIMNRQKIPLIFLSSDQVFDGSKKRPFVNALKNPQSLYGQQKAKAEELIKKNCENAAIVRLTKVAHSKMHLFCKWNSKLSQNQSIEAYQDLTFCPISLEYIAQNIISLVKNFKAGTYHLAGDCEISYQTAAEWLASIKGVDSRLVKGVYAPKNEHRSSSSLEPYPPSGTDFPVPNSKEILLKVFGEICQ